MSKHDVMIVGDGIAGRAIALALAEQGFKSTLIASPEKHQIKGGVQLAPNAWRALAGLNVDAQAQSASMEMGMMRILALKSGYSLAQMELNSIPSRTPYRTLTRSHLLDTLGKAIKATGNVTWLKGNLSEVMTKDNFAVATLDDGKTLEADWLIGGDSAQGLCRAYVEAQDTRKLAPDLIAPRIAFRMVVEAKNLPPLFKGAATTIWLGDGGHVVHYPLADGTVNIVAVVSQSPSAQDRLAGMMEGQPILAPLIEHLDKATQQPLFNHQPLDVYQRGRVVLTGDAGHPMPPHLAQGAGQALVDAERLKHHLEGVNPNTHDLAPIFTEWSAERVRAIRRITTSAKRAGRIFAMRGSMAKLRNLGIATFGSKVIEQHLDTLWRP